MSLGKVTSKEVEGKAKYEPQARHAVVLLTVPTHILNKSLNKGRREGEEANFTAQARCKAGNNRTASQLELHHRRFHKPCDISYVNPPCIVPRQALARF